MAGPTSTGQTPGVALATTQRGTEQVRKQATHANGKTATAETSKIEAASDNFAPKDQTPASAANVTHEAARSGIPTRLTPKQVAKEALADAGGVKGAATGKVLLSILKHGVGLKFIRHMFEQVGADDPPLKKWDAVGRVACGAAMGAVTMLLATGVPLGITGAAMSAAGGAGIPLLAFMGGCVLWGAVAGAYQGYKSTRPEKRDKMTVTAKSDGETTTVHAKPDVVVNARSTRRDEEEAPMTATSSPDKSKSADTTTSTTADNATTATGIDPAASVALKAAKDDAKREAQKKRTATGIDKQADAAIASDIRQGQSKA